jgi:hypothetical protein
MKLHESIKNVLISEVRLSAAEEQYPVNKAVNKFSKILHDLNNYINIEPSYQTSTSEGLDGSIWADIVTAENNDVLGNIYIRLCVSPVEVRITLANGEQEQKIFKEFDINDPALLKLLKNPLSAFSVKGHPWNGATVEITQVYGYDSSPEGIAILKLKNGKSVKVKISKI